MINKQTGFTELLHNLMLGLFYPAVLGTVFFSYLPYLRNYTTITGNLIPFFISFGLLIHFCIDFVYTKYVKGYGIFSFLSDLIILFMLYVAFDSVNYLEHAVNYQTLSISLSVVYTMFLLWDFTLRRGTDFFLPLVVYQFVALIFFLLAFLLKIEGVPLVIGIILASVMLLVFTSLAMREYFTSTANKSLPELTGNAGSFS